MSDSEIGGEPAISPGIQAFGRQPSTCAFQKLPGMWRLGFTVSSCWAATPSQCQAKLHTSENPRNTTVKRIHAEGRTPVELLWARDRLYWNSRYAVDFVLPWNTVLYASTVEFHQFK